MELRFEETNLPEDVSREMANENVTLGAIHVPKVVKVLMVGVSKLLGDIKSTERAKAIAFRRLDGSFIAGAKVEYHPNTESPDDVSAGNWSYVWTFYEGDLEGADVTDMSTSNTVFSYFIIAADKLHRMKFTTEAMGMRLFNLILEGISHWLDDNAKDGEVSSIVMPGVLNASCTVVDGVVEKAIVPDGDVKTLIKSDNMMQEAV